jgi:hypothetical protein
VQASLPSAYALTVTSVPEHRRIALLSPEVVSLWPEDPQAVRARLAFEVAQKGQTQSAPACWSCSLFLFKVTMPVVML